MQAQRKLADAAPTASPIDDGVADELRLPRIDGSVPASPALLLQEQLAARLAQVEAIAAEPQHAAIAQVAKLPMALRIATIVGLSLALWGGVFLVAVAALT